MFSFFQKNETVLVPEWASFFSGKEYSRFNSELISYFDKLNIEYKISDGIVNVNKEIFGFSNLGLTNVAQVCKQEAIKHYKAIIFDHFDSMLKANEFEIWFSKIVHDFEKVKKYIGVRLYDNEYVSSIGKDLTIGKDFAGNIYSMLVFDLAHSIINVQPGQFAKWNQKFDDVFNLGIRNIMEKYPLEIKKENFKDSYFWFVHAKHFFAPNIVFELPDRSELIGSRGTLIGLPHRHSAIIYPIEDLEIMALINPLLSIIYGMNQEGPGSLSHMLYWYIDGEFIELNCKPEDGKLKFIPPDRFVKMLKTLEEAQ